MKIFGVGLALLFYSFSSNADLHEEFYKDDLHEQCDVGLMAASNIGIHKDWQTLAYVHFGMVENKNEGNQDFTDAYDDFFIYAELRARFSVEDSDFVDIELRPISHVDPGMETVTLAPIRYRRDVALDLEHFSSISIGDVVHSIAGFNEETERYFLIKLWMDYLSYAMSRRDSDNALAHGWHVGLGASIDFYLTRKLRVNLGAFIRGIVGFNKRRSHTLLDDGSVQTREGHPTHWLREFFAEAEYSITDFVSAYAQYTSTCFTVHDESLSPIQETDRVNRAMMGLKISLGKKGSPKLDHWRQFNLR